jgi:DNA-binding beta-propeller fold protein YncE
VKARSAWLLSRFAFISSLLFCGTQIAEASAPAVVADGQIALASGLQLPEGVAVSSSGTVYVADTGNNRVVTVSPSGVLTPVSVPGYTLSGPGAVAVDSTGDLFIADSNNARVLELKTSGSVALIAGAPLLNYPASLAFDPAGDLYIGDANNLAIYKVSASTLQTGSGSPTLVTISNVFRPVSGSVGHRRVGLYRRLVL